MGQVPEDRFDRVPWLLAGDAKVFLERPRHRWEHGLSGLLRIERNSRRWFVVHSPDMREGLFGGRDETGPAFLHASLVFVLLVEAFVVRRITASGMCGQHGPTLTLVLLRLDAIHFVELERRDGLLGGLGHWDALQVRIVDREAGVVLLQYPNGSALNAELADGERLGFAVRTANNLDVVDGLAIAQLQQDDGNVVDEEERVGVVGGERDEGFVVGGLGAFDQGPGALGDLVELGDWFCAITKLCVGGS